MEDEEFFPENYDYEGVFDEKIFPLLKTIVNICDEYGIPMVCSFQFLNEESRFQIGTTVVSPPKRTCKKIIEAASILLDTSSE